MTKSQVIVILSVIGVLIGWLLSKYGRIWKGGVNTSPPPDAVPPPPPPPQRQRKEAP